MTIQFEVGNTYITYTTSGLERLFVCTEVSECDNKVRGSFNGGKEKLFRTKDVWKRGIDQKEGKPAYAKVIEADTRYKLLVSSDHKK